MYIPGPRTYHRVWCQCLWPHTHRHAHRVASQCKHTRLCEALQPPDSSQSLLNNHDRSTPAKTHEGHLYDVIRGRGQDRVAFAPRPSAVTLHPDIVCLSLLPRLQNCRETRAHKTERHNWPFLIVNWLFGRRAKSSAQNFCRKHFFAVFKCLESDKKMLYFCRHNWWRRICQIYIHVLQSADITLVQ